MDHIHEVEMFIFNLQFGFCVLPIGRVSNGEDSLTEESLKTMSRYRNFTTICCAAVFALGLAACGGGDDGIPVAERDAAVAAEQAKTVALQKELDALRTQLGLEDDGNVGDSVADLQAEVMRLEGLVEAEEEKQAMADAAAMTAKLNKLAAGIAREIGIDADSAVATGTAAREADDNNANLTKPKSNATMTVTDADDPHAVMGWAGSSYTTMVGTGATKVTTTVVVYDNKEAPTSMAFNKVYSAPDAEGRYTVQATSAKMVEIDGLPTHPSHDGLPIATNVGTPGKFDGVSGMFTASSATTIKIDTNGNPDWSEGGNNLLFKPNSATANVMVPDSAYMSLGWWLAENASGNLTPEVAAWASGSMMAYGKTIPTVGKAKFSGIAVGKYTHKTINSIEGGHFNAAANLEADLATNMLKGTIDGFESDGEPIGSGWKVTLSSTTVNSGAVDGDAKGKFGTQETTGKWVANYYDNTRRDDMPGAVGGTFSIGQASHPINMVGAFAASNMEMDQPKN